MVLDGTFFEPAYLLEYFSLQPKVKFGVTHSVVDSSVELKFFVVI